MPDEITPPARRESKRMPLAFKIPIIAIPVLTLALIVPGTHFFVLKALGRTYHCTIWQDLNAKSFTDDNKRRVEAIRASSHEIQSDDQYTQWRTRDGDYWIPKRNKDTLAFNLAEEEQDIYGRGDTGVHSGDVVLDGGANVGVFTRKALNAGAAKVVAVEPAPENVESLRRNFAPEIVTGRVVIQAVGLWNQPGELPLRVDADDSARNSFLLSFGPAIGTVMVPLRTIDSIVEDLGVLRVDFIKLDIEGAEKNALAGARQTLARFRPRMAIAMEHLPDDATAIPAAIDAMGLGYATTGGPCFFDRDALALRPDTLYFAPGSH